MVAISNPAEAESAYPDRPGLFVAQLPVDSDGRPRIRRVLIANRGEIACRVIATCRKLNIISIAVFVDEDVQSKHITDADEAVSLGKINQSGGNPFLNVDLIVKTAISTAADAIHPGYGYLSENAGFADAVRKAGLIFIGPSPEAMSTLGDKRTAKDYLRRHAPEVPLIPGFAGSNQDPEELEKAAAEIGYPIMLKASAGGGGKGMRIVTEASKLKAELTSARSEAARSFGSGDCILEKYIEAGKHIEIQIVGDNHGHIVSLWERECSIQRRHQKVIEESPSPWLTPEKRRKISDVATRIGELLGYENAGTVEFVVDVSDGSFYFLEVNTRLQVEHPITEEVTGVDIVALQLFVASGGDLSSLPMVRSIPQHGHAIECRLCAEDPQRGFFPENGVVRLWDTPNNFLRDVRFETAIQTGSEVSINFDSMIAKIVVWAPTRAMAIKKMITVLSRTVCIGVKTNQLFMQNCLLHPSFSDPFYTTSFIPNNLSKLLMNPYLNILTELQQGLALIPCLFLRNVPKYVPSLSAKGAFHQTRAGFRNQRFDPVNTQLDVITVSGNKENQQTLLCQWLAVQNYSDKKHKARVRPLSTSGDGRASRLALEARYNAISNEQRNGMKTQDIKAHEIEIVSCDASVVRSKTSEPWIRCAMVVSVNGSLHRVFLATERCETGMSAVTRMGIGQRVFCHFPQFGSWIEYKCYNMLSYFESIRETTTLSETRLKAITAPMPCKVLAVLKKDGEQVKAGETVIVVESMKMEVNISASLGGKFSATVRKGDAIDEGALLCNID